MEQAGVRPQGMVSFRAKVVTRRRKMGSKELQQVPGFQHKAPQRQGVRGQ